MPTTAQPIFVTPDAERLRAFYAGLLDATEIHRVPGADGPVFFLGLRAGDFEFGIVVDDAVSVGTPGRVLVSIDVDHVDALLPRITELGGTITGGPTDMPWGQRVVHLADPDGNAVNLTQSTPPVPADHPSIPSR